MSALGGILLACGAVLLLGGAAVVWHHLNAKIRGQRRTIRRLRRRLADKQARVTRLKARVAAMKAAREAAARAAEAARVEQAAPDLLRDVSSPALEVADGLVFDGDRPSVVLLLQSFSTESLFAGVKTAVTVAAKLAAASSMNLRIIVVDDPRRPVDEVRGHLAALVGDDAGCPELVDDLRLSVDGARLDGGHTREDVWVATFWTTALAADHLARSDRIRANRVIYLIQDFEPGFYPWGDLQAKAWSTYRAGFTPLVNSSSLARFVEDSTGLEIPRDHVIAPALDVTALEAAAAGWSSSPNGRVRVLFYARPSKPRNMFTSGLQALRLWADNLPPGAEATVVLAGEPMSPVGSVDLGPRVEVETLGKVSYADYYQLLSRTDIGLALMHSPHPGHLALEMALAGIPTLTNEFQGYRVPWVTNLTVAGSSPDALADALGTLAEKASALTGHQAGHYLQDLGTTLDSAVAAVARRLEVAHR